MVLGSTITLLVRTNRLAAAVLVDQALLQLAPMLSTHANPVVSMLAHSQILQACLMKVLEGTRTAELMPLWHSTAPLQITQRIRAVGGLNCLSMGAYCRAAGA